MGMGFQTWEWDSRHGNVVPDIEWGSRQVMWYQRQVRVQTWDDGVPADDGVPGRGGVATFTSHQSGILHSLIIQTFVGVMILVCEKSANIPFF